jgi:2-polyprenyl-3-methyl-5-hydroxy-6-metoxy-1,4-benzoquinol methylase
MNKLYNKGISISDDTTAGKLLAFVGHDKKVLEIGCASGIQSKILRDVFRCNVVGIEINPIAAEQAKHYCDQLIVGDIESMGLRERLGDKKFDVILMADVLEHLKRPDIILDKLKTFLNDESSYIVISVPNIVHASVVYQMMQGIFNYSDFGLLDDTHIRFFSKYGITELLNKTGFDVIELRRVLCDPTQSEIKIDINSIDDYNIMTYLLSQNQESLVYQYVIKAKVSSTTINKTITIENNRDLNEMLSLKNQLLHKYSRTPNKSGKIFNLLRNKFMK